MEAVYPVPVPGRSHVTLLRENVPACARKVVTASAVFTVKIILLMFYGAHLFREISGPLNFKRVHDQYSNQGSLALLLSYPAIP